METAVARKGLASRPGSARACRVRVEGIVQGVGFRPFVSGLANRLGLGGIVRNDPEGVEIEIEGPEGRVDLFLKRLVSEAPPLAVLEDVSATEIAPSGRTSFAITESQTVGEVRALVSPDVATCDACLAEVLDPTGRRYGYPFTNCTNCGPRFTIVRDVPYDRPRTTMAVFGMCAECEREYHDPSDRRFHAQPVACPACGPKVTLLDRHGSSVDGDPIRRTAELLRAGRIVAVKGLGGYHLAADATHREAVDALRSRKHREDKPFAVMVGDVQMARRFAETDATEEAALAGPRRPIVLVRRRADAGLAPAVAPGNRWVGLMLPYTPLHHLLCRHAGRPFVLTSGNVSDEPIAYEEEDAFRRLSSIADFFLVHDRPIHMRTDDSVVRIVRGEETLVRRSRGYAPRPLRLSREMPRAVLACGAELKNTFCLARGVHAYLSHHVGDLENWETFRSFREGVEHYQRLFDVHPEIVAHDLHPEYLSTKYALGIDDLDRVGVQHHHAHVASCLADNMEEGPAIGVAFDGLGFGTDGTLWGGEFLLADLAGFERIGHLEVVPMPGGSAAIREPWRMAAAWLDAAYDGDAPQDLDVVRRNRRRWGTIVELSRRKISPATSSVGRLFDAVAALLGIRDVVRYEGQAAVELEQRSDPSVAEAYDVHVDGGRPFRISGREIVRAVVEDLRRKAPIGTIAARFHETLARIVVEGCKEARGRSGHETVALSGGVFQNTLLLERVVAGLENERFRVLTHRRVPPNDGGISLGQTVVAAARDPREF